METRVVGEQFEESEKKIEGFMFAADPSVHISLHITFDHRSISGRRANRRCGAV